MAVGFSVPNSVTGEGRHFCLIEGVASRDSELDDEACGTNVPRRGRLVELPGDAKPGRWDAVLLPTSSPGGPSSSSVGDFRISLRHESASSMGPLEREDDGADGVYISAVRPAVHRSSHLERQGVISPEEADGAEEDGDTALRLGCLSLAVFAGCTCSSSVLHSKGTAKGILGRCEPDGERGTDELLRIAGDEGEGVLYPCSLTLDTEYAVLLCHDGDQNVIGIDGKF